MAKAGNCRATGGVEVTLARAVYDVNAITLYRKRMADFTISRKNVAHLLPGWFAHVQSFRVIDATWHNRASILTACNINVNAEPV